VPVGRLSDRLGRKRMYLWGFGLFTVASAGCALAPALGVLAAIRAIQGAGAALLQANSVAIVATAAPRGRLRTALGLQAAAQAVGLAVGPTVGGLIVQTIGWRWVFALNVPVGLAAIVAGRFLLPRTRFVSPTPGRPRRLPVRGLLGALLAYLLLFGPIVLVPSVLQGRDVAPAVAGLVVASLPVGFAVGAGLGARLLPSGWSTARRCLFGIALTVSGVAGLLGALPGPAATAIALTLVGLGLGVFTPVNNAQIMAAAPADAKARTGGLVSAARAAGTGLGIVLVASTVGIAADGRAAGWILLALAALCTVTITSSRSDPLP
jgi:MFS family permease